MDNKKQIVKKVIDYIEKNFEEKINLDKISESVNYSKFHLNRIFAEETGYTIHKYIQMRRLTLAAHKLVNTDETISEIAFEAGYNSQQAFTFAFKNLYSCSPKIYREIGIFNPKQDKISMNLGARMSMIMEAKIA